jgi:hypothetical protein
MEEIFAVVAKLFAAFGAKYSIPTLMTFRLFTNIAIAKMVQLGKIVTFAAAKPGNRFHLAVFAILSGARHPHWPKFCTVAFTKASKWTKLFRKLFHGHETQNGIPIQKVEHIVAHEILREHLVKAYLSSWILLLGLVSPMRLFLLCHGEGAVVAFRAKIEPLVPRNTGGDKKELAGNCRC